MRWGIPYPLAGVHVSYQLVQFTEAHASEGVVRWRELYQYRAAPRVVLLTPWLDPADWCRALSRSVAAEASVCECLRECIDGGRGGATESGQIAVQEQRFLPRSPCATEQQLATRRPAAANYEAVNGSSERRAEIRAGWGIAERGKNSRWMDGVVCVCGMGKSVSLLDGKIFLIPASNRQERCWCRDSRSSRIGASASSSSSSSRRTLPFDIRVRVGCLDSGECCLRFEKGGQRRGHSPCGPKTLRIHPTPTCPHACAMQAGSRCIVARWAGGLEWRGIMLRCRALAGAVSRACDRRCIPYGVGSVATEQGRHRCQPPTKNYQQDTRRKRFQPLLFFSRNTCAVSVAEESTTARPGRDTKRGWALGTSARPDRPPPFPPVPRRGVPSIAQCVESWSGLRNADEDRSSRSSLLHRDTTLNQIYCVSRPNKGLLPPSPAAAPRPHWSGNLGWASTHPIPRMQNGKLCFVHAPAREMAGVVRHSPAVAEWTIRRSRAGERSGREAINTGSRPCDRPAASFCATLPR